MQQTTVLNTQFTQIRRDNVEGFRSVTYRIGMDAYGLADIQVTATPTDGSDDILVLGSVADLASSVYVTASNGFGVVGEAIEHHNSASITINCVGFDYVEISGQTRGGTRVVSDFTGTMHDGTSGLAEGFGGDGPSGGGSFGGGGGGDPFAAYPDAIKSAGGWFNGLNGDVSGFFGNASPTIGANVSTPWATAGYITLPGGAGVSNATNGLLYSTSHQAPLTPGGHSFVDFWTIRNGVAASATMWGARDSGDTLDWFRIITGVNGEMRLQANDGTTQANGSFVNTGLYTGSSDVHIVVAFNQLTQNMTLWVNGSLEDSAVSTSGLTWSNVAIEHGLGAAASTASVGAVQGEYKNYGRLYYGTDLPGSAGDVVAALLTYQQNNTSHLPPTSAQLPNGW